MKRCLLSLTAIAIACLAACKKDVQTQPTNGAPTSADSYLPVTTGSTWTYYLGTKYSADTVTIKMNATNATVGDKTYYTANSTSKHSGSTGIYFYEKDHIYAVHSFNIYADTVLDLQLYNDTASIGKGWVSSPTPNGKIDNTPARVTSTITQRGLSKAFAGKTYNDLVKVTVSIQYDRGGGYGDVNIYTYYLSKGIGIVAYTSSFYGEDVENESLISYTIK